MPTSREVRSAFIMWSMLAMLVIGHAMDVLTTAYAVLALDAREANPLMKIFAHNPFSMAAIKYYAMRWIYPPVLIRARQGSMGALFLHTFLIWCVVFWNLGVIIVKGRKHGRR